jgi:hypothetical protein
VEPFAENIDTWIPRGNPNAAELFRTLVEQGFDGGYDAVRRYLARRLGSAGRPGPRVGPLSPPAVEAPPAARRLSFAVICRPEEAALTENWSNGAVEGQVNRLKVIKRQMYGRAGLALMRARVRKAS